MWWEVVIVPPIQEGNKNDGGLAFQGAGGDMKSTPCAFVAQLRPTEG